MNPIASRGGVTRRTANSDPRLQFQGGFDAELNEQLRESLPPELRRDYFDRKHMPAGWLPAIFENQPKYRDKEKGIAINLRGLPESIVTEFVWCLQRKADLGLKIFAEATTRAAQAVVAVTQDRPDLVSLLDLEKDEWVELIRKGRMKAGRPLGPSAAKSISDVLGAFFSMLIYPYHRGEWWQLNVWNPMLDPRIPMREHEPLRTENIYFSHLTTPWLREGAKYWLSRQLEREVYTWSTLRSRQHVLVHFQRYLDAIGCQDPQLAPSEELGSWIQEFRGWMGRQVVSWGSRKGNPLGATQRRAAMTALEQLYRFMFQEQSAAARALGRNCWGKLTPQHAILFRFGDKPTAPKAPPPEMVLSDTMVSRIVEGCEVLELPPDKGGFGDPQLSRILKLLIKTGRRVNEITMLDFEPLIAIPFSDPTGHVARLRYQQTKISTGDATILVDQEIVDIIREQQMYATDRMRSLGSPDIRPKYLFLGRKGNRHGDRPYSDVTARARLLELGDQLDLRDEAGRKVILSKTHMFRHTKATNLLKLGVPIHVGMRYMGHQSPTMFMHYAQTLAETQEAEFLRYRKLTADGREYQRDPREMFEALALSERTDRVLPHGYCTLPPRQSCDKGNACLTCTKFVTDETFEPALRQQLNATEQLISDRQQSHQTRFGEPMSEENIWLKGRTSEVTALNRILHSIDTVRTADGTFVPLRGAGAPQYSQEGQ